MESYVDSSHFSQIFSSPAESNIIVSSEPSSSTSSSIHFQYEHFYISKQYLNTASSSELSSFSSSSFSDQMLPLMEQTDLALASDYEDNTFQNFLSDSSLAGSLCCFERFHQLHSLLNYKKINFYEVIISKNISL